MSRLVIFVCSFLLLSCTSNLIDKSKQSTENLNRIKALEKVAISDIGDYFSEQQGDYSTFIFKTTDQAALRARVWLPPNNIVSSGAAIVFFYGGAWSRGTIEHFSRQASYFASLGIVAITTDYRVSKTHGVTPAQSLSDAKSAMRWVRAKASKFNYDANKIVAFGGSAGGHLAAATAVVQGFDDEQDDLSISTIPNALVLFNPVIDNSPSGWGNEKVKTYWRDFSVLHNVKNVDVHPPTLVLLGSNDKLIPVETGEKYVNEILKSAANAKLVIYPEQPHGFFNQAKFVETLLEAHTFIYQLNLIDYPPVYESYTDE